MLRSRVLAVTPRLLLFLAVLACEEAEPPAGGTSSGEGSSGAEDDDADPTTAGMSVTSEPATSSSSTGEASSASGDPVGCTASSDCAGGEYCDFADDSCGASGMSGACAPIVEGCDGEQRPVCACGDVLHDSICAASAAGLDVSFVGECPLADPLAFRCGYSFCISDMEYCLAQAGAMPSAECIALPPVCVPTDCSCITSCCGCDNATCCSEFCINDDGDLTFTCP